MLSVFELVYKVPYFASPGTPFPNKKGVVDSKLNGKVRYASSYNFIEENGIKKCCKDQYLCSYGIDGRLLYKTVCDNLGRLLQVTTYEYNEIGLVTDILTIDSKGKQESHYIFKYSKNYYTYEWINGNNISCGKHTYMFDSNQNIIEERWDSKTPENRWMLKYIYDDNNQEIEFREYKGADKRFARKNLKTYDKFGNLIKHVYVDADGSSKDLGTCKFDEYGRCVEYRILAYGHPYHIKYDNSNNVIEITNQEQVIKVIHSEPNFITLLWFDKESFALLKKCNVNFDKHHNITSIINYEGENLQKISGRLFTYEYYLD